jgi:7-cyano-7-deazaguanine reductase
MPASSKAPARGPRAGGRQNVRADGPARPRAALKVGSRPSAPVRTVPSKTLDVFANPNPERDYLIHMQVPEFTCLCPLTGQPDFAHLAIDYVADASCVELKSLKLYVWSFRDEGAFHEAVTNRVLDDLVAAMQPRFIRLTARWGVRGGIFTNIVVEQRRPGWTATMVLPTTAFAAESPYR